MPFFGYMWTCENKLWKMVVNVNIKETKEIIEMAWDTKMPIMLWGSMGIGKTAAVRQFCEEKQIGFVDIRLSEFDEVDLRGIPTIDKETKTTVWYPPSFLPAAKDWKGIVFFDEITNARPSVQNVCLKIIQEGKIGDWVKSPDTLFLAAGNRAEDKAHIFEMSAPLLNRFGHVTVECELKEWCKYAIQNDIDYRIISFLNFKPDKLHTFNAAKKTYAFATPRTYEYTSKAIKGNKDLAKIKAYSTTFLGEGVAIELSAFIKLFENFDVKEMLAHSKNCEIPTKVDEMWSLVGAVGNYVVNNKDKDKEALTGAFSLAQRFEPEYAILLLQIFTNSKMQSKTFDKNPEFLPLLKKYGKYI